MVDTLVDKISFEEKNGQLQASSVTLVDKAGTKRKVKARKEIIVAGGRARIRDWTCSPNDGLKVHIARLQSYFDQESDRKQNWNN